MVQITEEPSKDQLQKTITAASNAAGNIISLDALKEIDEEVQYAIATHQSHLNPWSKQAFTLYFIFLFAFLNATSSGFDGSLMGSINAESQYKNFFHLKETGSSTGLVFILYNAASMIGCAFGGPNHGLLWEKNRDAIRLSLHTRWCSSSFSSPDSTPIQSFTILAWIRHHSPDALSSRLRNRNYSPAMERETRRILQHILLHWIDYRNWSRVCYISVYKHSGLETPLGASSHPSFHRLHWLLFYSGITPLAGIERSHGQSRQDHL